MSLRETLRQWEALAPALLNPTPLGESSLCRTTRRLETGGGSVAESPPVESIEELAHRLREALARNRLDDLSARDWARAAFALWHGEPPLADEPRFVRRYLDILEQLRRRSAVGLLISAYLRKFSPGRPGLDQVAATLARLVRGWSWAWAERQRDLQLFDPARAPAALAEACLAEKDGTAVLKRLGLEHLHGQGLVLVAQLRAVELLEAMLSAGTAAEERLERVQQFAVDERGVAPGLRGPLADALLRPWAARPVPDALKKRIQDFLLQRYGDPRLNPQRWQGVSDEARLVFKKWLARAALAQFLEVIDRSALDSHWKYRRAFWTAYFQRDWVWDARVAFGRRGAHVARQLFGEDTPFAELKGGGSKAIEDGHAVLLMCLGDLTIADWSHNGQCVIWKKGNRTAPSLNLTSYTSDDVHWSKGDACRVHAGAASYSWQSKVRDFIHRETNLWLPDSAFRVSNHGDVPPRPVAR